MWRNQILCQVVGWVSSSSSTWVFCWNLLKIFDDLGCGIREILQKLALWKWQYPSNGGRLILSSTLSIANIFYVLVCHLKKCELETLEDPKILPLWYGALEKKKLHFTRWLISCMDKKKGGFSIRDQQCNLGGFNPTQFWTSLCNAFCILVKLGQKKKS